MRLTSPHPICWNALVYVNEAQAGHLTRYLPHINHTVPKYLIGLYLANTWSYAQPVLRWHIKAYLHIWCGRCQSHTCINRVFNKRPKGPYIVHLSTMWRLFGGIGQGGHFFLLIGPKNKKLGRGRWDLVSCRVSLNSVQRFQRRIRECLGKSEARAVILFFRSAQNTQTWLRTSRSFCLSSFFEFRSAEKSKISQPIRGQGGHLVFPIGPKNTTFC